MDEQNNVQNAAEEDLGEQMQIRREKLAALKQNGENPYECTSFLRTCNSEDIKSDFAAYEGKEVSVAGRIISRRMMGKASFSDLQDKTGTIQLYVVPPSSERFVRSLSMAPTTSLKDPF